MYNATTALLSKMFSLNAHSAQSVFCASVDHHDRVQAIGVYQHSVGGTSWHWLPHYNLSARPRSLIRIVEADVEVREDVLSPPSMGTARPSVFADEVDLRVVPELDCLCTERDQVEVVEAPYSA